MQQGVTENPVHHLVEQDDSRVLLCNDEGEMVLLADVLNITLPIVATVPTQHLHGLDRCFVMLDSVGLYSSFLQLENACVSNWSRKTEEITNTLCPDAHATNYW